MILERTIFQLDTGDMSEDEARQMGQLGYMQWIAGLKPDADYAKAASAAYDKAAPFMVQSPAVAAFCALLKASLDAPLKPLPLSMPPRQRRGGAQGRRAGRLPL